MSDTDSKNLDIEPLRLIDVCSEDDCLLASPSGFPEYKMEDECFDLFEVKDATESKDTEHLTDEVNQEPVLSESVEAEFPRKNGKCNLRKSLAWDKAFFTNEGVLDSEELSFINNGVKKASPCPLPGIEEDMRRSADSNSTYNSTLDSDSLTLESLEVDLFDDIRASIQRSSEAPNLHSTSSKKTLGVSEQKKAVLGVSAPKKTGLAGRNGMRPSLAPKRVTTKEATVRPRLIQPVSKSGESNPTALKPPKIIGRVNPVSAVPPKKTSLTASRVKVGSNTAKPTLAKGETVAVTKKPSLLRSSVTSRPTTLPKSSQSSTTQMKSSASCSSYSTSGSTSSDSSAKSPLMSVRNKINSRTVVPVSGSTLKSPIKISSRNRTEPENSRLSVYLKSIPKPKISSNISPASSIDGWSSESSSSTSTLNQYSNGPKANIGINSPRQGSKTVGITDSPRRGSSLRRDSHASQASEVDNLPSVNPSAKKISQGSAALAHPASTNVSKSFKPSGLRMPSPKIGFFDAEKSLLHTPNGSSQSRSGARSSLSKAGSGPVTPEDDALKTKARTLRAPGSLKLDSKDAGLLHSSASKSLPSPGQPKDIITDALKLGNPSEVQNDSFSGSSREKHLKTMSLEGMSSLEMVENSIKDQKRPDDKMHSPDKTAEKQNSFCSDDQVDDLIRQVANIDLNVDDVNEAMHEIADPKLDSEISSPINVHHQEDLKKMSLKPNPLCLSPKTIEILSNTRAPLEDNVSLCSEIESFRSEPESTMNVIPSVIALPNIISKEN